MQVLIITILCGVVISASHYVIRHADEFRRSPHDLDITPRSIHPLLWPLYFLSLLNALPRIFVTVVLCELLGAPGWLGEVLGAIYWPALGAFVGTRQDWALWGGVVLAVHVGVPALLIYAMSRSRF